MCSISQYFSGILIFLLVTVACYQCSTIKTCSFETQGGTFLDSMCLIQSDAEKHWKISASNNTSIPEFHGKFAIVHGNGKKASFSVTQYILKPLGCLTFWYYSPAENNTIQVSINHEKGIKGISTVRNYWTYVEVGFFSEFDQNSIEITAKSFNQLVAIDEINFLDEPCRESAQTCTFSHGACSFQSPLDTKWLVTRNESLSRSSFMSANLDGSSFKSQLISTVYPPIEATTACLDFKFLLGLHGDSRRPNFEIKLIDLVDKSSKPLWSMTTASMSSLLFTRKVLRLPGIGNRWRLLFEVDSNAAKSGFVAVTDVFVNSKNCQADLDCDFECDSCLWDVVLESNSDDLGSWVRKTPETSVRFNSTVHILPDADVTLNSTIGSYLFATNFVATTINSAVKRPLVRSQNISQPLKEGCFSFWIFSTSPEKIDSQLKVRFYHLRTVTTLNSKPDKVISKKWSRVIYNMTFNEGTLGYFEIEMVASIYTIIAIDNIRLEFKGCLESVNDDNPPDIADMIKASVINCDFDHNDVCRYVVPAPFEGEHFNWKLTNDYPGTDRGAGQQQFLVSSNFNGLPSATRNYTELVSPQVMSSAICYFHFEISSQGDSRFSVWSIGEDSYEMFHDEQPKIGSRNWTEVQVIISPSIYPFRLCLRSERRDGIIAIKHLHLKNCTSKNVFPKRDGTCSFNFEVDCLKQWLSPEISAASRSILNGPTRDADLSRIGNMAIIRAGSNMRSNPFLRGISCALTFQYMLFKTSIQISLQDGEKNESLAILRNQSGNQYSFDTFSWSFNQSSKNILVVSIETLEEDRESSYAAIDNTFFSPECLFLKEKSLVANSRGS